MAEELDQYMKPHGKEGIEVIRHMNEEHQNISEFAFSCVEIGSGDKILDIGCGGGVNIEKFLKATSGCVDGLDYSEVSVSESAKRNQSEVDAGRCRIIQANVSDMPIEDDTYDIVSAFSTIFFWKDLNQTFKEVYRIIKPGGQFMAAQGTDGTNPLDKEWIKPEDGINVYTAQELEQHMLNAGFESVEVFRKEGTYLLAVIGKKEGFDMAGEKNDQCMKPHGEEGIETVKRMNENHREISEFAFDHVNVGVNDKILDIGCGGGANIEKFLKLTNGNVDGLDYSEVSVSESAKRNREAIDEGRCKIIQADVSAMPLEDESYDLASAFETVYFWPDIAETFKEVYRIVRPNGQFLIGLGTDGNHPDDEKWLATVEGMSVYTAGELERCLLDAGFSSVESHVKENDYILAVIAKK